MSEDEDEDIDFEDAGSEDFSEDLVPDEMTEFADDSLQGFNEHNASVFSVSIDRNTGYLTATGGADDKAFVWDNRDGRMIFKIDGFTDSVVQVAFSANGKYLAAAAMNGLIKISSVEDGSLVCSLEGPSDILWIQWHSKGNILVCGSSDHLVWMWMIPSGDCMNVFSGHSSPVHCGTFTPDGKHLISGSDQELIVWNPKTGEALIRYEHADPRFHQGPINSVAIYSDNTLALSGGQDNKGILSHLHSKRIIGSFLHEESVEATGFSNSFPVCATGALDGSLCIWDLNTNQLRSECKHDDGITKLIFEHHTIVTGSLDQTVRMWDCRTGENVRTFNGHQDAVLDFDWFHGKIITGSDDGWSLVFGEKQ